MASVALFGLVRLTLYSHLFAELLSVVDMSFVPVDAVSQSILVSDTVSGRGHISCLRTFDHLRKVPEDLDGAREGEI